MVLGREEKRQMPSMTVDQLLSEWYASSEEEFVGAYQDPVIIGVGILDVRLLRDPHRHGSTLCLGFERIPQNSEHRPHPLVGHIFPVVSRATAGQSRVTIGRSDSCDIVIEDPAVSETHCAIEPRGEEMVVIDLGSTNGTLVNGTPLEPSLIRTLLSEDILTLGRHSFQYFTPVVLYRYLQLSPAR